MAPFVGANIEGELSDGAFEGFGKDSVGNKGVSVASRVKLVLAGGPQHVVDFGLMGEEMF